MATNLERASKVAKNVEMEGIFLRSTKVETGFEPDDLPQDVEMEIQYRTGMQRRQNKQNNSQPEVAVNVEFRFRMKGSQGDESIQVISLDAEYLLVYLLNPNAEIEEDCFKHFAEVNGPYNAWPYWRELVHSVTGRVGLPGIVVPVFRPAAVEVKGSENVLPED